MAAQQLLLNVDNVSRVFGGLKAVSDVNMQIQDGELVGLIGPNGAGKTTLFNLLTGVYEPSGGKIHLSGESVGGLRPYQITKRGAARTFQNIRLFAGMTVWEHLVVAQPSQEAALRRLLPMRWVDPAAEQRAQEMLQFFGLSALRDRVAAALPYGVQRKVEMARALSAGPKLLLLDEPVAGMNADEADEVRRLLLRLRESGLTTLLIEHDMTFVMDLCDYLYVLDFGALIAEGRPEEVRSNAVVLDAYLGHEADA